MVMKMDACRETDNVLPSTGNFLNPPMYIDQIHVLISSCSIANSGQNLYFIQFSRIDDSDQIQLHRLIFVFYIYAER